MLSGEERNLEGIRDRTQEGQNLAPPKSQLPFLPLRPVGPTLKNGPKEKVSLYYLFLSSRGPG